MLYVIYMSIKKNSAQSPNGQVVILPSCSVSRSGLPWEGPNLHIGGSLQLRQKELIARGCLQTTSERYTQVSTTVTYINVSVWALRIKPATSNIKKKKEKINFEKSSFRINIKQINYQVLKAKFKAMKNIRRPHPTTPIIVSPLMLASSRISLSFSGDQCHLLVQHTRVLKHQVFFIILRKYHLSNWYKLQVHWQHIIIN